MVVYLSTNNELNMLNKYIYLIPLYCDKIHSYLSYCLANSNNAINSSIIIQCRCQSYGTGSSWQLIWKLYFIHRHGGYRVYDKTLLKCCQFFFAIELKRLPAAQKNIRKKIKSGVVCAKDTVAK